MSVKNTGWEELGGEVLFSAVVLNRQGALFSTTEKNEAGGRKDCDCKAMERPWWAAERALREEESARWC